MIEASTPHAGEELPPSDGLEASDNLSVGPILDVQRFSQHFKEFIDRTGGLPDLEKNPNIHNKAHDELARLVAKNRLTLEKLKQKYHLEPSSDAEVRLAFAEAAEAAQHNKPLEAVLERRHEIKDIADSQINDPTSIQSILADKRQQMIHQKTTDDMKPSATHDPTNRVLPNMTYRSAIYYGNRGGIVIAVIIAMLYLLFNN